MKVTRLIVFQTQYRRNLLFLQLGIFGAIVTIHLLLKTSDARMNCGTVEPIYSDIVLDHARMLRFEKLYVNEKKQSVRNNFARNLRQTQSILFSCEELCRQCIEIETFFHLFAIPVTGGGFVIPHPTSVALSTSSIEGSFTSLNDVNLMIDQQMMILNEAYSETPFRFNHLNRNNATISTNLKYTNFALDHQREMSAEYGFGDLKTLNIFVSFSVKSKNDTKNSLEERGETVAFASLPSYQQVKSGDGVFIRYDCLPNGGLTGTDHGYTLVHEVGHWFGLYHTFQSSINIDPDNFGVLDACSPQNENDYVSDTVVVAGPTDYFYPDCTKLLGGTEKPDTCPNLPGSDQVFNYMNYVSDEICFKDEGGFTCGQIERMNKQWLLYRDRVDKCDKTNEMEIEIFIKFDKKWYFFENRFYLINEKGEVIFNSTRDHIAFEVIDFQDSLLVDLCVPSGSSYNFTFEDSIGDGFSLDNGSYFAIFVNGKQVKKVQGNFGFTSTINISVPYNNRIDTSMAESFRFYSSFSIQLAMIALAAILLSTY